MVIIYGKTNCTFCEKAKQLCNDYQLDYEYKNIAHLEYLEEMVEKFPGAKTVPQIIWYNNIIGTYENFVKEIENTIGGYGENAI